MAQPKVPLHAKYPVALGLLPPGTLRLRRERSIYGLRPTKRTTGNGIVPL
jgi:hypothetical protein